MRDGRATGVSRADLLRELAAAEVDALIDQRNAARAAKDFAAADTIRDQLTDAGIQLGAVAGVFHTINHAVFKASLFMATGIIDHECGTRDIRKLNGLYKYMPHTALLAMVATAAMAGVPLLNGFLSKEMLLEESLHAHAAGLPDWSVPAVVTLAALFSVTYSFRFAFGTFFGERPWSRW